MMRHARPLWLALATFVVLSATPSVGHSQSWLGYYPGGHVVYYHNSYAFLGVWDNQHWPSPTGSFTYRLGEGSYKTYQPTNDPDGKYFYVTPKAGIPYVERTARMEVKVPVGDADIWFEGVRTGKGGLTRLFRSPALVTGRTYKYEILALWNEGGREVKKVKIVTVQAGDRLTIDFSEGDTSSEPKKSGL